MLKALGGMVLRRQQCNGYSHVNEQLGYVNRNSVSVNSVNHEQGDGHLPCDALQCLCVLVLNLKCTRTLTHGCVREELFVFYPSVEIYLCEV